MFETALEDAGLELVDQCFNDETCGGAGVVNQCGQSACIPTTCEDLDKDCGFADDGCGDTTYTYTGVNNMAVMHELLTTMSVGKAANFIKKDGDLVLRHA